MPSCIHAWVFAGGHYSVDDLPSEEIREGDKFICVDRGVEHCLQAGFQPDVLIGDLDSVAPEILTDPRLVGVPRHIYPSRKAASDLEIALELLVDDPPQNVILLAVSGGRTDHMLFNWLLPALRYWPYRLQLIDESMRSYVLCGTDTVTLKTSIGRIVSLVALQKVEGVTTTALEYPLAEATLLQGSTLGLSNIASSDTISVAIDSGTLLVLVQQAVSATG